MSFSKISLAAVPLCVGGLFVTVQPAAAACTSSADYLTLSCGGTLSTAITLYDPAAAYQPTNGSNSYTPANPAFPAATNPDNPGYNPNPPTLNVNLDSTTVFNVTTNSASVLADKGLIVANYSNTENPAVNNVILTNAGSLSLTTSQISTSRMEVIVADSQVNNFTVNNSGTIAITQNYFSSFSTSNLSVTSSGSPATYTAKYSGNTLNDMAALYSDDNTNEFILNNEASGQIIANGNYATGYYGRADTTITNSGTIENTNWKSTDTIANGDWAIAAYAGTDYETVPGTNPDSDIVAVNTDGSVTVDDTSALTLTNNKGGTIKGDILALDITPLVYAAAVGSSTNPFPDSSSLLVLPLAVSSSNAGPRDSNIENYGTINGNFYLGSGTHVIDNAEGATINGNVDVDQRASTVSFSTPVAGSVSGTYLSAGGTDYQGNTCPASGQNTTNAGCAQTTKVLASVVGGQSLTLTNEGTWNGDINIFDTPTSVNTITLTGSGFTGNVNAVNGTGSNSLTLDGVTQIASINNFSSVDLQESNVLVQKNATTTTTGVNLVAGATLATTIYGAGGQSEDTATTNLGSLTFASNSGSLNLAGATTIVPTLSGIARNGDYYVLADSVTGDTSDITITSNSALVTWTATTYSDPELLLEAHVANANTIPGISQAGASAVNALLNYGGDNAPTQALGGAVESLTTASAVRSAAEQLRPEVNGASIQVPLAIADQFQSQISNRIETFFYGELPQPGTAPEGLPNKKGGYVPTPVTPDNGVWFNAIGSNTSQQTVDNVSGYRADTGGFVGGYDHLITDNFRLGGAIGYGTSSISDYELTAHTSLDSVNGLIYGAFTGTNWYVNAVGQYGGLHYNESRGINFDGFSDTAAAGRSGSLYSGHVDGGYAFLTPFAAFVPIASLTYAHITQGGYSESSQNGAGLTVAQQQTDSLQSGLGGKVIVPLTISPTFGAALEGHAYWLHEFDNTAEDVWATFVGSNAGFQAIGPGPSRDSADVGADLRISLPVVGDTFSVGYNAIVRNQYIEQAAVVRARFDF
jgi:uncharacterized protein with beta-barrel porin domain